MMFETIDARASRVDGWLAVELDYEGGSQSMVLVMPEDPERVDGSAFEADTLAALPRALCHCAPYPPCAQAGLLAAWHLIHHEPKREY